MTLYEFNQAGYNSLPKMAKSAIEAKKERVSAWLDELVFDSVDPDASLYLMLLNNELHYYTIFNWMECSSSAAVDEIFSVVKDLGTLKAIEKNDNGSWEFWVTLPDATTHTYFLFDYTQGVIEL